MGAALLRARPGGLRVPVCGDWLFPERREGLGGGPRARSRAWEGDARFLLEAALPSPGTRTPPLPPHFALACHGRAAVWGFPEGVPGVWGHLGVGGIGEKPGGLVITEARARLSPLRALFECVSLRKWRGNPENKELQC